jgi:ribonucleoside-triphosphate reductase
MNLFLNCSIIVCDISHIITKGKIMLNDYETYIHLSRYSKWIESENRRENYEETIERYITFFKNRFDIFPDNDIRIALLKKEIMPSMRTLRSAGKALERDEVAGYNCSYLPIDDLRAFDELMYILMCGTGVGFSVEEKYINKLDIINIEVQNEGTNIVVPDSKIGWATSFRQLLCLLYAGITPTIDYSRIRKSGEKLKTFGGTASGPDPLKDLFNFCILLIRNAAGRRLKSIEVHDIINKIAEIVIVGGVRRSALISLSDIDDIELREAKSGMWWKENPHRALSNNSAVYETKPDIDTFKREWKALYESKSGERGIFNRFSLKEKMKKHGRRDYSYDFGTNPCGEIGLRPNSFCNLSEVVVRDYDDLTSLKKKVELATILGTFQSTLTNFRYLRPIWKINGEDERLLGVSLTGIMDNRLLSGKENLALTAYILNELREHSIAINQKWAKKLGINCSMAIGTVKPSGTVSQLVNSSSGIHPRYSNYYIRTVRSSINDPLSQFLISQGVPNELDNMKPNDTIIFKFPIKSPTNSIFRNDMGAIEQLDHYIVVRDSWCEHNPSITVYVKEEEWDVVGEYVYNNFDKIGGVSFLPYSDHIYEQAPYQEIDEDTFNVLLNEFPKIDWSKLTDYDIDDTITSNQELACVAGGCDF